ncbi:unnamed protein product [Protopolystoma xenopodis]|uniref:Uncharacterized protein n=1 Tax=Protopolystoma xenopodis TaxID=117903 RepID=A0A448XF13_9PLAT|nr:unnamed protein product [Protopolystoma xenopodis]
MGPGQRESSCLGASGELKPARGSEADPEVVCRRWPTHEGASSSQRSGLSKPPGTSKLPIGPSLRRNQTEKGSLR